MENKNKEEITPKDSGCILYKISSGLDYRGFREKIYPIKCKETDKSFISDGLRVSKDKLMKIDTIFVENHKFISYHTYCLEGDKERAAEMLRAHVIEKIKAYKSEVDNLFSFIPKD